MSEKITFFLFCFCYTENYKLPFWSSRKAEFYMDHKIWDVIIVGGGPGGYTAALYCGRAALSVLVLEKMAPGGQMGTTDQIDNYPGFPEGINGFDLAMQMQQSAERFGAQTRLEDVVSLSLEGEIKTVVTSSGEYKARTVVLATGAAPRELGLPRERELRGRGVSYCATCDGMFYRGKEVVVVGGGNTAAADALYLSKLCGKVTIVHRRDTLRASKAYLKPLQECGNVEILWDSLPDAILGENAVSGLRVKNKKTGETQDVPCAGIFVAIGNEPNTALFADSVALDGGYVAADETTRTNLPGVFAVGDVRRKPLRQVVTAVADGAMASHFIEEYLSEVH